MDREASVTPELWAQVSELRVPAALEPVVKGDPRKWTMKLGSIRTGPGSARAVVLEALERFRKSPEPPSSRSAVRARLGLDIVKTPVLSAPVRQTTPAKKTKTQKLAEWRLF